MAINDMTIEQISSVLNAVVKQATGQNPNVDTTNPKNFVTVAQNLLKTGYDPVMSAISQVLTRTIFSVRPYNAKFGGLYKDAQKWGNHVRKINYIDDEFENDDRLPLTDGQSVDPWIIKKPRVIQSNFYGEVVYQRHVTIFKDQLDTAFRSPSEFGSFITGVMQNIYDQIAQANEELDRACIANFIAGKYASDTSNVIHLVTEYNDYLGLVDDTTADPPVINRYTSVTIRDPEVYSDFIRWVYARVKNLTDLMSERSMKFHVCPLDGQGAKLPLMRHTPADRLKMYLYSPVENEIAARVLSDLFHDEKLKFADHERVTYWQSIDHPETINCDANYYKASDGSIDNTGAVLVQPVFGVLFDEEAIGVTNVNEWSQNTGMNPRGGYYSIFWHWTRRYYNDFCENGVVLLLD